MRSFSTGGAFRLRGRRKYGGLRGYEGKPIHPPLTDIPIGAYIIAPILDIIAFAGRNQSWGYEVFVAAGLTLLIGGAFSLITALTGVADWSHTKPGSDTRRIANAHGLIMVLVTAMVLTNLGARFLGNMETTSGGLLALSLAILAVTAIGGAIGGTLVYDHGMRVAVKRDPEQAPQTAAERAAWRRAG